MEKRTSPQRPKSVVPKQSGAARSIGRAVPLIGLTYVIIGLSYQAFLALSGSEGVSFRIVIFVPFILAFAAGTIGIWLRTRWGYVVGVVSSALFVALGFPYNLPIFLNPADPLFLGVWTGNVALVVVAVYTVSSFTIARLREERG